MALPAIFKRKSFWVVTALVLVAGIWYWRSSSTTGQITYETAPVIRTDVVQTVEVTGTLKPATRIDLAFKMSGTLGRVAVKKSQKVKQGDILAELKNEDLTFAMRSARAALSIAQANLASRLAGETSQSIRVAQAQVEQAQAAIDKADSDLANVKLTTANSVHTSEIAVQTAKNSLDNSSALSQQNVSNSYDTIRTTLLSALGPLNSALTDGDQIIGVDNSAQGSMYVNALGVLDSGSVDAAKSSYKLAKQAKTDAEVPVKALTSLSSQTDILAAAEKLRTAIEKVQTYLTDVQRALGASITTVYLTPTQLTSFQTTISADRTSVSAQNTTVLAAIQTIKNTELTRTQTVQGLQDAYTSAQLALDTGRTNASVQVKAAETAVITAQANLSAAQATLDLKKAGPRSVDVMPLRAAVEQSQVAYEKSVHDLQNAQIIAPVDGTVSDIIPNVGEQVTMNVPAVKMVGTETYSIEALTPEVDIAKVELGQSASITLDAYGDDVKFKGTVTAKDPDQTKVQDAVYYKTYVQIEAGEREIKPGMTSNVTITTGEKKDVLSIPLRAIRTTNGDKTVRVLKGDQPETRTVTIGLKGDEGKVEVLSGVQEGEKVIVSQSTGK